MIRVLLMTAYLTFRKMPAHAFGAAGKYVGKRPFVAWKHPIPKGLQILITMFGHNIGKLDHGDKSAIRSFRVLVR
jgi:hypothetical protein